MKTYELMVVFRTDFPVDDEKKICEFLTKLTGGAVITNLSDLGKKLLAYPIKKIGVSGRQTEGIYVTATAETEYINMAAIEKGANMKGEVLRYLITARKERG